MKMGEPTPKRPHKNHDTAISDYLTQVLKMTYLLAWCADGDSAEPRVKEEDQRCGQHQRRGEEVWQ